MVQSPSDVFLTAFLPRVFSSPLSVASKLVVDQGLFSPALCAIYYVAMKTLEGTPCEAGAALRERLWPTVTAAWLFWVPAQCMNFRVVGPEHRFIAALGMNVSSLCPIFRLLVFVGL